MQTKIPRSCRRGPIFVPDSDNDSDDESLSSVYEPDTDESSDDDEVLSTESVSLSNSILDSFSYYFSSSSSSSSSYYTCADSQWWVGIGEKKEARGRAGDL